MRCCDDRVVISGRRECEEAVIDDDGAPQRRVARTRNLRRRARAQCRRRLRP